MRKIADSRLRIADSKQKGTKEIAVETNTDGLLKAGQLALKLNVSLRLLRRMVKDKEIPVVWLGKAQRFYYPDVLAAVRIPSESAGTSPQSSPRSGVDMTKGQL